jgi:hypothetical protein
VLPRGVHFANRGQVYESLAKSGELPEEKLRYFDAEGAEFLLYEYRFLTVPRRIAAAEYIVDNQLDKQVRAAAAMHLSAFSAPVRGAAVAFPTWRLVPTAALCLFGDVMPISVCPSIRSVHPVSPSVCLSVRPSGRSSADQMVCPWRRPAPSTVPWRRCDAWRRRMRRSWRVRSRSRSGATAPSSASRMPPATAWPSSFTETCGNGGRSGHQTGVRAAFWCPVRRGDLMRRLLGSCPSTASASSHSVHAVHSVPFCPCCQRP